MKLLDCSLDVWPNQHLCILKLKLEPVEQERVQLLPVRLAKGALVGPLDLLDLLLVHQIAHHVYVARIKNTDWRRPARAVERHDYQRCLQVHLAVEGCVLIERVLEPDSCLIRESLDGALGSIHDGTNGVCMSLRRAEEPRNLFDKAWIVEYRHAVHLGQQLGVCRLVQRVALVGNLEKRLFLVRAALNIHLRTR